jgi:hypothetical protein
VPVRGILIDRDEAVAQMKLLEQVCMPFLYGRSTDNRSCACHKNPVLREERGYGGGIVLVEKEASGSRLHTTQTGSVSLAFLSSADDVEGKCKIQSSSVLCIGVTLVSPALAGTASETSTGGIAWIVKLLHASSE